MASISDQDADPKEERTSVSWGFCGWCFVDGNEL